MSQQPGTIEQLAIRLGRTLAQLGDSLGDDVLFETLARLGLAFPPALLQQPAVTAARNALVTAADKLPPAIDGLLAAVDNGDLAGVITKGEQLRSDALALIQAFDTLPAAIDSVRSSFPEVTDTAFNAFVDGFPRRLLDLLIADALDARPGVGAGLTLAGIVERTRPFETTDLDLADLTQPTVRFDRITRLLTDPEAYFGELYDWGSPAFDGTRLLPALYELLALIGVPTAYHGPTESNRPLLEAYVVDVTPNTSIAPPGLDFSVVAPFGGAIDETVALAAADWSARFTASGRFSTRLTATLRPPLSLALTTPAITLEGSAEATVVREADEPLIVLGSAGGSRVEVKTINVGAAIAFSTAAGDAGRAPTVTGKLQGGRLVVDGSQGDGFISTVLSGRRIEAPFDVGFTWSLPTGLRFDGSSSLTIVLPASIDLGPVSISGLTLAAGLDGGAVTVAATAALSAMLGPVQATVSGIGFAFALSFPADGGNFGPAQIDLTFRPPTLIGIGIDAGMVTGGGFLEHDEPNGRYAGMIALSFSTLQMQAIGLIDTRLPNGNRGYSFLIIVSVKFSPIQLGFGFTLNGVGGLCGIDRDLVTDALHAALRAHNLDHVLFPPDPVADAPAIISDLRSIFPPRAGRSVFAPMFEIAWGGELELVRAELGIVVSMPSPIVIAVLGTVRVALPSPDAPIVDLHVDALGTIEFGQKRFSVDASLYDSRIAGFSVTGAMAMRLDWGDRPSFALAIGGVNPHFEPPPGFPTLQRLTIALASDRNFRLTVQSYFAVTSNTYQIGARAELYAASGGFNVYGWIGYDALIIFRPFSFVADFSAGLALRRGTSTLMGISVKGELSGPAPWHAKGNAHISLLFFDIGVHFDITWGEAAPPVATSIDVWPQLRAAVADPRNWSGVLPANVPAAVTLARPIADRTAVLVEPSGVLTLRERLVPLNQPLGKFGELTPGPQSTFTLDTVALGGHTVAFDIVRDKFAAAQFEQLSDQDKLSRPSFEDRDAGFSIGARAVAFGSQFGIDVTFNDIYIDDHGPRPAHVKYPLALTAQLRWAGTAAGARSSLRAATVGKYTVAGAPQLVSLDAETFVVASVADLQVRADITRPATKGEALLALSAHLDQNPADRDLLQVIPIHEAAA